MPFSACRTLFASLAVSSLAWIAGAEDIPSDLLVDVRVIEARSVTPDFKAMEELAFFINTDGDDVTEQQWLATVARQATDSFLANIAFETLAVDGSVAKLELARRSRRFELSVDLSGFVTEGVFHAQVSGELARRDEAQRAFEQTIELRFGQTFAFSGRELELSASEYLSHFRDYEGADARRELYDRLRDFTTFLIVLITPRLAGDAAADDIPTWDLPDDVVLPSFESPLGIELIGTVELELDIDDEGAPTSVTIVRSSIPEVNSRLLGEAEQWRFPDAKGQTGRVSLKLNAMP